MFTPNYYMKAPEFVPNCLDIDAAYGYDYFKRLLNYENIIDQHLMNIYLIFISVPKMSDLLRSV